jgi:hypothetical protein
VVGIGDKLKFVGHRPARFRIRQQYHVLSHTTNHENETAEVAESIETDLFSAFSAFSAVIFPGIGHVLTHATKDENGSQAGRLCHILKGGSLFSILDPPSSMECLATDHDFIGHTAESEPLATDVIADAVDPEADSLANCVAGAHPPEIGPPRSLGNPREKRGAVTIPWSPRP